MNHDNAISATSRLKLETKTSKAGNQYVEGTLYLVNDYPLRLDFLNEQAIWAINDALKVAQAHTQSQPIVDTQQ